MAMVAIPNFRKLNQPLHLQCNSTSSIPTYLDLRQIEHQSMETARHPICICHVIRIGLEQEFNQHLPLQRNSEFATRENKTRLPSLLSVMVQRVVWNIFHGDGLSLIMLGGAPKERRRRRAEKPLSKRVFLESPFLLCPLKVFRTFQVFLRTNLKGAEKKRTLQKHPFGQPFLRTTPSPLLWRTLNAYQKCGEARPLSKPSLSDPTEIPPLSRDKCIAILLSHCVSCGIAEYRYYTPTSFHRNGLSQSKDSPNKDCDRPRPTQDSRALRARNRGRVRKESEKSTPGQGPKGAERVRPGVSKESEQSLKPDFRTLLRLRGALFRHFWGPGPGYSFRTLPRFRAPSGPGVPVWGGADRKTRGVIAEKARL